MRVLVVAAVSAALLVPTSSAPATSVASVATTSAVSTVTTSQAAASGPAPAAGTRKRLYRIPTFRSREGGRAISTGTVRFIGRNVVDVIGRVNDICPGDGFYGYFQATARLRNGKSTYAAWKTPYGCDSGPARTKNLFTTKRYIVKMSLRTCLAIQTGAPPNYLYNVSKCRYKTIDNPKVRGR